jgi:deoxyribonuclease-4
MLSIGAHLSAAGSNGLVKAIETATTMGATAMQVFVSSPRSKTGTKKISEEQAREINAALKKNKIKCVIHSPYTINLSNEQAWAQKLLQRELEIAEAIGAVGVVVHMGKSVNMDKKGAEAGFKESVTRLTDWMKEKKMKTKLVLETPAGQGTELFVDVNDFCDMYNQVRTNNLGICIDTCHVFAAGYTVKEYLKTINKAVGYKQVAVVHVNDSKKPKGSRIDRHENLGLGYMELDDIFYSLSILKENKNVPFILETPDENLYGAEITMIVARGHTFF